MIRLCVVIQTNMCKTMVSITVNRDKPIPLTTVSNLICYEKIRNVILCIGGTPPSTHFFLIFNLISVVCIFFQANTKPKPLEQRLTDPMAFTLSWLIFFTCIFAHSLSFYENTNYICIYMKYLSNSLTSGDIMLFL